MLGKQLRSVFYLEHLTTRHRRSKKNCARKLTDAIAALTCSHYPTSFESNALERIKIDLKMGNLSSHFKALFEYRMTTNEDSCWKKYEKGGPLGGLFFLRWWMSSYFAPKSSLHTVIGKFVQNHPYASGIRGRSDGE